MSGFRGFINDGFIDFSIEPHLQGDNFSISSVDVPNSVQYSLRDLIASGQKLALTDTAILHDENAIGALMDYDTSMLDVESSND